MKRFLFLSMLVFIGVMVWVSVYDKEDDIPLSQKLERAMKLTRMKEYHDDDYNYTVRYPSFFEQTPDSLLDKGCCRFSFWQDNIEVVQTAFIKQNPDSLTLEQAMTKYASEFHVTFHQIGHGFLILSGHILDDNGRITSRCFHAKFMKHRKLWFVQSLTYSEQCEQAIQRIIKEIDNWKVW